VPVVVEGVGQPPADDVAQAARKRFQTT
jgi:hypothetical protein